MTLKELTSRPGFSDLSDDAKLIVMRKTLDGFADMSEEAQKIVLRKVGKAPAAPAKPALDFSPEMMLESGMPAIPWGSADNMLKEGDRGGIGPFSGAVMGGLLGSMGGIPGALAGSRVGAALGGIAGSGLGAGIGESVSQLIQGYSDYGKTADEVLSGAKGQLFGEGVTALAGPVLKPVLSPFAAKMSSAVEGSKAWLGQKMVESGIPISPSSYAPSGASRLFQWVTDNILPGRMWANSYRNDISEGIMKMRADLIEKELGMISPFESHAKLSGAKKQAWSDFLQTAGGPDVRIPIPAAREIMDVHLGSSDVATDPLWSRIGKGKGTGFINDLFQKGGVLTFREFNDLRSKLWSNYAKLTPAQKSIRGRLKEALDNDLSLFEEQSGNAVLEASSKAYEAFGNLREFGTSRWLERLLDGATEFDKAGQRYEFFPAKFDKIFRNNEDRLRATLTPEQFKNLNAFRQKALLSTSDLAKKDLTRGEVPMLGGTAAGAAAATYFQPWLAVPLGFQTIVARSVMNPSGWVRKWLTTGLTPPSMPMTREVLKVGSMMRDRESD